MKLISIGYVKHEEGFRLELDKQYVEGLQSIEGFSYLVVTWWANQLDDEVSRSLLTCDKPYKPGPEKVGVFATRSPMRPNPICISLIDVRDIDYDKGIIYTSYIDAADQTPVLDIKPYFPCLDRLKNVSTPDWCADLPKWYEDSGTYDWSSFFNF